MFDNVQYETWLSLTAQAYSSLGVDRYDWLEAAISIYIKSYPVTAFLAAYPRPVLVPFEVIADMDTPPTGMQLMYMIAHETIRRDVEAELEKVA